jgi:hypothetical protein
MIMYPYREACTLADGYFSKLTLLKTKPAEHAGVVSTNQTLLSFHLDCV